MALLGDLSIGGLAFLGVNWLAFLGELAFLGVNWLDFLGELAFLGVFMGELITDGMLLSGVVQIFLFFLGDCLFV